jgi:hypothetical protein
VRIARAFVFPDRAQGHIAEAGAMSDLGCLPITGEPTASPSLKFKPASALSANCGTRDLESEGYLNQAAGMIGICICWRSIRTISIGQVAMGIIVTTGK